MIRIINPIYENNIIVTIYSKRENNQTLGVPGIGRQPVIRTKIADVAEKIWACGVSSLNGNSRIAIGFKHDGIVGCFYVNIYKYRKGPV